MSQPLPVGSIRWINVNDIEEDNERVNEKLIERLVNNSKFGFGYLLEVDVDYPRELHDSHNDLPFLCEKIKVDGIEKLIPNSEKLIHKEKYVIHIKLLKQNLDLVIYWR